MKVSTGCTAFGLLLVEACSNGNQRSTSPGSGAGAELVAGGETSEFSGGDIPFCPELSSEPRDLREPELAAMAKGQHELAAAVSGRRRGLCAEHERIA